MRASMAVFFLLSLYIPKGRSCYQYLNAQNGRITAPDSDNDGRYEANMSCWYFIEARENQAIKLTIIELDISCGDLLVIYDGYQVISSTCDTSLDRYVSNSRLIRVYFWSDGQLDRGGFSINYELIQDSFCGHDVWLTGLIGSYGTDLNHYYDSRGDLMCVWVIHEMNSYAAIQLYVSRFTAEPCVWGIFVEVFSSLNKTRLYCQGNFSDSVVTFYGDSVGVKLLSKQNSTVIFDMYFASTDASLTCGGIRVNSTGVITSVDSDGDGYYDNDLNCVWTIVAPENYMIEFDFDFDYIDVEYSNNCQLDEIKLFDRFFTETAKFLQICGHRTSQGEIWSTMNVTKVETNILIVQFLSNDHGNKLGFVMSYDWRRRLQRPQGNRAAWKMTMTPKLIGLTLLIGFISIL